MVAVVQRVLTSKVIVHNKEVADIDKGLLVLLGVANDDSLDDINIVAEKIANLRIFEDENEKMNLSILDINGEILVVPNFTLCGDVKKGRRPNFMNAAKPEISNPMFCEVVDRLKKIGIKKVEQGIFGADMKVELINDGPVTIIIDTVKMRKTNEN